MFKIRPGNWLFLTDSWHKWYVHNKWYCPGVRRVTCHNVMPVCQVSRSVMSGSQTIFKPITINSALLQTIFGRNTTLQSISRAHMLGLSPWNFILVLLRISGCESHKCYVDIRMALQSDLIKAVFILRRPVHLIFWPTFNFKPKPFYWPRPHNGACWRCQRVLSCPGWQNVYLGTSFNT